MERSAGRGPHDRTVTYVVAILTLTLVACGGQPSATPSVATARPTDTASSTATTPPTATLPACNYPTGGNIVVSIVIEDGGMVIPSPAPEGWPRQPLVVIHGDGSVYLYGRLAQHLSDTGIRAVLAEAERIGLLDPATQSAHRLAMTDVAVWEFTVMVGGRTVRTSAYALDMSDGDLVGEREAAARDELRRFRDKLLDLRFWLPDDGFASAAITPAKATATPAAPTATVTSVPNPTLFHGTNVVPVEPSRTPTLDPPTATTTSRPAETATGSYDLGLPTATMATTATGTPISPPAVSSAAGKIAYLTMLGPSDTDYALMSVRPDGSGQQLIADGLEMAVEFHWSPDGSRIAFTSAPPDLWVANADGTGRTLVLHVEGEKGQVERGFDWSPDGSRLVVSVGGDIQILNLDGSGLTNLTSSPGVDDTQPAWSPDGQRIAFISYSGGPGLMLQVIEAGSPHVVPMAAREVNGQPVWSPDSSRIAVPADGDIWLLAPDGSRETRLTNDPYLDYGIAWSPGGMTIAFTSDRALDAHVLDARIFLADLAGAEPTVRDTGWVGAEAAWSPNGVWLVFPSVSDGEAALVIAGVAGGQPVRLVQAAGLFHDWGP